jgi:hypothetical protein
LTIADIADRTPLQKLASEEHLDNMISKHT